MSDRKNALWVQGCQVQLKMSADGLQLLYIYHISEYLCILCCLDVNYTACIRYGTFLMDFISVCNTNFQKKLLAYCVIQFVTWKWVFLQKKYLVKMNPISINVCSSVASEQGLDQCFSTGEPRPIGEPHRSLCGRPNFSRFAYKHNFLHNYHEI